MTEFQPTSAARTALTPNPSPERRGGLARRLRRHAPKLIVFLLLGAIINVAVAWAEPYTFGTKHHQISCGDGTSTYEWELYPRRGWPFASLSTEGEGYEPGSTYYLKGDFDLPFSPIWPGFPINTIIYAATLWMLFTVPLKLRRFIRNKRQRCPGCGYPIGTSPVCTECGVAVTVRQDKA